MSHIFEPCPLTKLNGGLSRLHYADEDAVSRLTSYGSWHAYMKKQKVAVVPYSTVENSERSHLHKDYQSFQNPQEH